ncbi:hypothetical protein CONCODRAFT_76978 [Conidiobolus coronatus NRRL 28638]|uniref:Uncharacterized protein n=1 Tax=Conidiobolus coronatus (strain ATCC 28846 / CBS 209.66 / NRRL 28638) TaxID=796925 RepID=A0A137PGH1_CONC2|nr:hypothetical protein CONCODRAFT_76978 [Conidiobolus coronatus NRRL 28638]|eukprot:KXN74097.1 hypothetical protein CONCODRAFT_76978 [Conidiobolus coronatus NRRL 28638]
MKFASSITSTLLVITSLPLIQGALQDCIITNNCGTNIHCMAYCAGVPDPSPQQVSQTERCVNQCNAGPSGQVQTVCNENCIIINFQGFPNTTFQQGPARTLVPVPYNNPNAMGNSAVSLGSSLLLTGLGLDLAL